MVGCNQVWMTSLVTLALAVNYSYTGEEWMSLRMSLGVLGIMAYLIYFLSCKHYNYDYRPENPGTVARGRTPPSYPNGWFVICRSQELKPLQVLPIKPSGYNIVLFRGASNEAFALHAFCPHSGAHLGVGGEVKHGTCVQCPFHGWLFDGRTGSFVVGETLRPRKVEFFCYNEDLGKCRMTPEEVIKKSGEGNVSLRKYIVKELNGFIYIWLHSDPNAKPNYEPLDISEAQSRLPYRGVSMNKIFAHCQDIVENGGDIRHFVYVHSHLLPFTNAVAAQWEAKWLRGDDPELKEKMKHKVGWVNEHKQRLFDKYLSKENASGIGVMNLDNYVQVLNWKPIFFFNATIFQVGPGLVYLFLVSPFYEAVFFQHTSTVGKFEHDVYHELYASGYLPYWVTALMLRLEAQQVTNDTYIWNNKEFASQPKYNLDSEADRTILLWRRWYSQFYEGCAKREHEENKYSW